MLLAPLSSPTPICSLFSFFIFYRSFEKSSSKAKLEIPFPTDPEMDSTLLNAPSNVFFTSEPAPLAKPLPPYNGLLVKPSDGNSIKSLKPEPIL